MRNLRKRIQRAVLAVPLAAGACFNPPSGANQGGSSGAQSAGATGSTAGMSHGSTAAATGASSTAGATTSASGTLAAATTAAAGGASGQTATAATSSSGSTGSGCTTLPSATGCASCDPVAEVCVDDRCLPTCNACGGCTNTVVSDPSGGDLEPGVPLNSDFADPCYSACGLDADGGPAATCHLEASPDGGAVVQDGSTLMICTWDAPPAECAPGAAPCAACDPARTLCDPRTGACDSLCGCDCHVSFAEVAAGTPVNDAGELPQATCLQICPDAGYYSFGPECHLEYLPSGVAPECEGQIPVACVWNVGCTGRRPDGFVAERDTADWAGYLSEMARLEAASVAAFRHLERDLIGLGAPRSLIESARQAARDEVRHARVVSALAQRAGQVPKSLSVPPHRTRSAREIAIENAVEGCVRETFGAALAAWQAQHAGDSELRSAMATIAEEEAGHAELAWELAAWLEPRLSEADLGAVEAARRRAIGALLDTFLIEPDPSFAARAGLPSSRQAIALHGALQAEVWATSNGDEAAPSDERTEARLC